MTGSTFALRFVGGGFDEAPVEYSPPSPSDSSRSLVSFRFLVRFGAFPSVNSI